MRALGFVVSEIIAPHTYPLDKLRTKIAPQDYFKVEIAVILNEPRAQGQSIEAWRHARLDYSTSLPRVEKQVTVAGINALEETVENSPGMVTTAIYIPYSDREYGGTVLVIGASPFRQPILEEVFRQILATFELLK